MKLIVGEPIPRPNGRVAFPLHSDNDCDKTTYLTVEPDAFRDPAEMHDGKSPEDRQRTFANMTALVWSKVTEVGTGDSRLIQNLEQADDYNWALGAYGEVVNGKRYQGLRFIEECFELIQTLGITRDDINTVADYVYSRETGSSTIEIGDVKVCLNILATVLHKSVAQCREEVHKKLALRSPEELMAKDKRKMEVGLI